MRTSDEDWALQLETCRIELSRGDVASLFFARGDDHGKLAAVCEPSTSFRWRGRTAPDSPEARLAHYELVARLKADGWAKTGDGDEWYAVEFTRPTLVSRRADVEALPPPALDPPAPVADSVERLPPRPKPAPKAQPDRWRHAAAVGVAIAVALLVWILVHG